MMALTPDELRKRIPQWSLESDGQLLQYMVQISKNLEEKCKQTQNNLNRLLLEVDESHIRFANASNNFNGVQQVKFVENRVKDDDESFYSVREEEEEKGEKLPHNEIFQMVVEKSVTNMYKCFEKVTVQLDSDSDSDDEDDEEAAARNTVLRAVQKYPYLNRPLPYIIGSQEWREKWHAGLIDSEEESDTETKEQYSDSSDSDGMFPSQANSNHTPSESEGSVWGVHADPRRRAPSIDPSVSGDDTLSIHSTSSAARPSGARMLIPQHKVPVMPVQMFKPSSLFPDQPPEDTASVSSRSRAPNLFEESDEDESTPTHKPIMQTTQAQPSYFRGNQPERKTVNLFADEPPPTSSYASIPASSHQQKKPVNLFIDSDDEDDSVNNNLSKANNVYQSEPPELPTTAKKAANLFEDNDSREAIAKPKSANKKPTISNIFDEVNNNPAEDDLFVPAKRSINGAADEKGVRRITNLFDDEPPVDDFDEIFKPTRKIPGGKLVLPVASKIPQHKEQVASQSQTAVHKKNLFHDKSVSKKPFEPVPQKTVEKSTEKIRNLFEEDDESDMFWPSSLSTKQQEVTSNILQSKSKVNLFDDDDDESDIQPSTATLAKDLSNDVLTSRVGTKSQLISSSETGIIDAHRKPSKQKDRAADRLSIRSEILKKKSIFDSDSNEEDDEDFLFGSKKCTTSIMSKKDLNPLPRQVEAVTQSIVFDPPPNVVFQDEPPPPTDDEQINKLRNHSASSKLSVPDEPPDFILPQIPPPDDNQQSYPHVSNDIDYYLTTNRITGPSVDSSTSVVDIKQASVKTEDDSQNIENNVGVGTDSLESPKNTQKSLSQSKETDTIRTPDTSIVHDAEKNIPESLVTKSFADDVLADPDSRESKDDVLENKSALNFSSVGLFDDVPPPDDDFEEPRMSQVVDQGDDGFFSGRPSLLSDTTAGNNANRYLFMDDDGPPPDDVAAGVSPNKDEVDDVSASIKSKEPPFRSISAIIDERNRNESSYGGPKEKPKTNKLSAKVNINVNALLPGARRPPSTVENQENESTPVSIVPTTINSTENHLEEEKLKPHQEPKTGSTKLTGLNKGRARIPVKRKPPSRQNRKANFEPSLANDTPLAVESNSNASDPQNAGSSQEEVRVVVGSEVKPQHVEVVAAHLTVEQILSDELAEKLAQPKLFDDTDNEDSLYVGKVTTIVAPAVSVTEPKKYTSTEEPLFKPSEPVPPNDQSSTKLFSDDNSDDDDLFGAISKGVQKPGAPQITAVVPLKQDILPNVSSSQKAQSIFDDTDDDDDLFSKPKTHAKSVAGLTKEVDGKPTSKVTNKTTSIFGSDEDSGSEDIFGGKASGSAAKFKPPSVTIDKKAARSVAPTSSLFGDDDDDDDDLFGSSKKSVPKPASSFGTTTKKTSKGHAKAIVSAADDPLADLLGS